MIEHFSKEIVRREEPMRPGNCKIYRPRSFPVQIMRYSRHQVTCLADQRDKAKLFCNSQFSELRLVSNQLLNSSSSHPASGLDLMRQHLPTVRAELCSQTGLLMIISHYHRVGHLATILVTYLILYGRQVQQCYMIVKELSLRSACCETNKH